MEPKELLIKLLAFFICLLSLFSCKDKTNAPSILVEAHSKNITNNNGTWFFKNQKFNGFLVEKKKNQLISKLPIIDGKENGKAYSWYENGQLKCLKHFLNGNREGKHLGWYQDGKLAYITLFKDDKFDGAQISYYKNGIMSQLLHYSQGYEEGKQKFWNEKGRLINNFTVKNGKLYGVVGRFDCMSVKTN